jgi:N,N'-diacetyllegionaminate synthase
MTYTYIIAEIGINHEGDMHRCKEMIQAAAESGADAVKLQTIDVRENYAYDSESYSIFERCQLSRDGTAEMFDFAKSLEVDIFTTVGDIHTARWVNEMSPSCWKVSSGLINHIPLIQEISSFGRPIFISTGMAEKVEIDNAVRAAGLVRDNKLILFHCTSIYPTPVYLVNLQTISWLSETYKVPVGFSDHSLGMKAVTHAVAKGAVAIEKHFTFDCSRPSLDHHISLEPPAFSSMVSQVREIEELLGSAGRRLPTELRGVRAQMLRCLVSRTRIKAGTQLAPDHIAIKRPGQNKKVGLAPDQLETVIGLKAIQNLERDEPINWHNVG